MPFSHQDTAGEVLGAVPMVMRSVRSDMRRFGNRGLSVPQFRALGFVHRHAGASLSQVAEHIGLTLPAMSRMVDGLVARELLVRRRHPGDRRRVTLDLTPRGRGIWVSARRFAQASLAQRLSALGRAERVTLSRAMAILRRLFAGAGAPDPALERVPADAAGHRSAPRDPRRKRGRAT